MRGLETEEAPVTDRMRSRDAEPLTPVVFHILLALVDEPRHGYAIMQAVEESGGPGLATGPGTVYGAIARLERSGLVREVAVSEIEDPPPSTGRGRPRKYFRITEEGTEALRAEALRLDHLAHLSRAKKILPDEIGS